MTEALAAANQAPRKTIQRVNWRKAMAGVRLLQGEGSVTECLVKSGFSPATARAQSRNGLSADQCIEEAAKLSRDAVPTKMLEVMREKALATALALDPEKTPPQHVARFLETMEKYYGGHASTLGNTLPEFPQRLQLVQIVIATLAARGVPVGATVDDAKVVDADVVREESGVVPPTSDNGHYDNPNSGDKPRFLGNA